jgi:hypothetical protein
LHQHSGAQPQRVAPMRSRKWPRTAKKTNQRSALRSSFFTSSSYDLGRSSLLLGEPHECVQSVDVRFGGTVWTGRHLETTAGRIFVSRMSAFDGAYRSSSPLLPSSKVDGSRKSGWRAGEARRPALRRRAREPGSLCGAGCPEVSQAKKSLRSRLRPDAGRVRPPPRKRANA